MVDLNGIAWFVVGGAFGSAVGAWAMWRAVIRWAKDEAVKR